MISLLRRPRHLPQFSGPPLRMALASRQNDVNITRVVLSFCALNPALSKWITPYNTAGEPRFLQAALSPAFKHSPFGWLRAAAGSCASKDIPAFSIGVVEVLGIAVWGRMSVMSDQKGPPRSCMAIFYCLCACLSFSTHVCAVSCFRVRKREIRSHFPPRLPHCIVQSRSHASLLVSMLLLLPRD